MKNEIIEKQNEIIKKINRMISTYTRKKIERKRRLA